MFSRVTSLVGTLLLCTLPLAGSPIVSYDFEDESLAPTSTAPGTSGSAFSLHNAGTLAFGAGAAAELFGPRGTAVIGAEWSGSDAYFAFTVTPMNTLLTITGLSFASLKEGSVAPGSSIYYRLEGADPVFLGQFSDFVSPPVPSFNPLGGLFFSNNLSFDLTTSGPIEFRIVQTGMPAGARFAVDDVILSGTATALAVPDEATTFWLVGALMLGVMLRRRS